MKQACHVCGKGRDVSIAEDARTGERLPICDDCAWAAKTANIKAVSAAIAAKHPGKPARDITDTIPCPICGGIVRYRISAYNGHRAVQCDTNGCVAWRE